MRKLLAIAVPILLCVGTPAWADAYDDCTAGEDYSEAAVKACTEVIEQGSLESQDLARVYITRGAIYAHRKEYDRAIADNDEAVNLDPTDPEAWANRGWEYAFKGNNEKAAGDCAKATDIDPKYADGLACQAYVKLKTGRAADGLPDAEQAVKLDDEAADAYQTRGQIYEAIGEKEKAIADYRKALKLGPFLDESTDGLKRLGTSP